VAEVLNKAVKTASTTGILEGILLPDGHTQQLLLQFADDSTLTLRGAQASLTGSIQLLEDFGNATGLVLNFEKSRAYWFSTQPLPNWTALSPIPWAADNQLSKLLGTAFGLNLSVIDTDDFLFNKIKKKLTYWTAIHLSLAARSTIVNSVLLSTTWYFISVWAGSRTVIKRIRGLVRSYLWTGLDKKCWVRVRWADCCANKKIGGLNIVHPEDALDALMAK
jgi:hypothetical protein